MTPRISSKPNAASSWGRGDADAALPPHVTAADIDRYTAQVSSTGDETAQAIEPFTGFCESQTTTTQWVSTPYPSRAKTYLGAAGLVVLAQLKAARRKARKDT